MNTLLNGCYIPSQCLTSVVTVDYFAGDLATLANLTKSVQVCLEGTKAAAYVLHKPVTLAKPIKVPARARISLRHQSFKLSGKYALGGQMPTNSS